MNLKVSVCLIITLLSISLLIVWSGSSAKSIIETVTRSNQSHVDRKNPSYNIYWMGTKRNSELKPATKTSWNRQPEKNTDLRNGLSDFVKKHYSTKMFALTSLTLTLCKFRFEIVSELEEFYLSGHEIEDAMKYPLLT